MKKKVITAVLCGLLITGLAGCGEQAKPPEKISPNSMASADASSASSNETGDDIPAESTASQEPETSAASTPERQPPAEESPSTPPAESQPKKETTPAQTEQVKPEPTAPEIQPEQKPQETPAEAPATPTEPETPAEPETPPQEVQPKTAYDFEFDIEAIKADCIGIGQSMGLTLDASLTPDTASWWNPVTASQSNQGETLKQNLTGYIRFHTADNLSAYGMDEITHFNIYCEARGNGVYSIYFLFA